MGSAFLPAAGGGTAAKHRVNRRLAPPGCLILFCAQREQHADKKAEEHAPGDVCDFHSFLSFGCLETQVRLTRLRPPSFSCDYQAIRGVLRDYEGDDKKE
jgi:hypothetical protein